MDNHKTTQTFEVNGAYLKREIRESLKLFFSPLFGLYAAITGKTLQTPR